MPSCAVFPKNISLPRGIRQQTADRDGLAAALNDVVGEDQIGRAQDVGPVGHHNAGLVVDQCVEDDMYPVGAVMRCQSARRHIGIAVADIDRRIVPYSRAKPG